MARGLPLSSLFYTTNSAQDTPPPPPTATATTTPPPPAWMWPSCKHPRTQSFRSPSAAAAPNTIVASLFLDSGAGSPSSSFANSSTSRTTHHVDYCASDDSLSTEPDDEASPADDMAADAIVRGLRSADRLLFEPRAPSSSILEKKPPSSWSPPTARRGTSTGRAAVDEHADEASSSTLFGHGVAVSFESADPYRDFRESMEEMLVAAAAHGAAGDRCWLRTMLAWYLGANGQDTHPAIITAFVDLVVCTAADDGGGGASGSSRVSCFTLAGSSSGGGHSSK